MNFRRFTFLLVILLAACQDPAVQTGFTVRHHPDGPLYVEDMISFEIIPPPGFQEVDQEVTVKLGDQVLGSARFEPFGIGQRTQATLWWVWDTRDLTPTDHTLTFTIQPAGISWEEVLHLYPYERLPAPEPEAEWLSESTECCLIQYISGTDAERDLELIRDRIEAQALEVESLMQASFNETLPVTLVPRVLGQGGFASDGIYISYLDDNYVAGSIWMTVQHEMVHQLDSQLGGADRPSLFIEGLAVYLTQGHYEPEPILPLASASVELGLYIHLADLAEDFYSHQHEVSYLEAGSLVAYMVQGYGWEEFNAFYRDIHLLPEAGAARAIDAALQAHFNIDLAELERKFMKYLDSQPVTDAERDDLRLTVAYYDGLRRCQELLDPSAYFMTAWMPDTGAMRERSLEADYLRHPSGWKNRLVEKLLLRANSAMTNKNYKEAELLIDLVDSLLDGLE